MDGFGAERRKKEIQMTRNNYVNEILQKLNEIEGDNDYWFHLMSQDDIFDKMRSALFSGCFDLFDTKGLEFAKSEFAKLAAMCMIAMDFADLKLNYKKGKK